MKILYFIFTILSVPAFSSIHFSDAIFPELITSARGLSMGNAFIAKTHESSSVFYNPAGLGSVRYPEFHFMNMHFEINQGWMNVFTKGTLVDVASHLPDAFDFDDMRKNLLLRKGEMIYSRFHIVPNITFRYISVGFLFSQRTKAVIEKGSKDIFEYADRLDFGPYLSGNISFFGGILKVGSTVFYLNRKEMMGSVDAHEIFDREEVVPRRGRGVIVNAGMKLTMPTSSLPTFAVTMHNANQRSFLEGGYSSPTKIPSAIDVGFSISPYLVKRLRLHLELNYKDIFDETPGIESIRKCLLGVELDFKGMFFLRLGYGDALPTAGFGIRRRGVRVDFTTYAVDTTASSGEGVEDRRFTIDLSTIF